jgi:simple sugar transport system permease protein
MMLFFILASDIFVRYRVRLVRSNRAVAVPAAGE